MWYDRDRMICHDSVSGDFVGHLSPDDPLHDFLGRILRDQLRLNNRVVKFRAFRLPGKNEVYGYQEEYSHARIVCKFYGSRFSSEPGRGALVAQQESDNLHTLRSYNLIGSPHHVIRPFGVHPDINCVLALEHYAGEDLTQAIRRAAQNRDDAYLFWRLKALAYYLATQHNRTANGDDIDFGAECDYFDSIIHMLLRCSRIGKSEAEEFSCQRDLWRNRPWMWQDRQVLLHGDAIPGNFLFGDGLQVCAIDLEQMRRGDRAFDLGRIAGKLQHAFMALTSHKSRAEPFISYFFREYSSHFTDSSAAFDFITARTPFYMALNLLRTARHDHKIEAYDRRLVRQAKRLLAYPGLSLSRAQPSGR
jgi:Phosphotransferase enzyme family